MIGLEAETSKEAGTYTRARAAIRGVSGPTIVNERRQNVSSSFDKEGKEGGRGVGGSGKSKGKGILTSSVYMRKSFRPSQSEQAVNALTTACPDG